MWYLAAAMAGAAVGYFVACLAFISKRSDNGTRLTWLWAALYNIATARGADEDMLREMAAAALRRDG